MPDPIVALGGKTAEGLATFRKPRRKKIRRHGVRLVRRESDIDIIERNAHYAATMPNPTHPTVLDNCRRCGEPAELEGPDSLCASCETDATAEVLEKLGEREVREAIDATNGGAPVVDEDGFRYGPVSHPSITPAQLFGAYSPTPVYDRYSRGERGQFSR